MFQLDIDNDGAQTLLDRASSAYKEACQGITGMWIPPVVSKDSFPGIRH